MNFDRIIGTPETKTRLRVLEIGDINPLSVKRSNCLATLWIWFRFHLQQKAQPEAYLRYGPS